MQLAIKKWLSRMRPSFLVPFILLRVKIPLSFTSLIFSHQTNFVFSISFIDA